MRTYKYRYERFEADTMTISGNPNDERTLPWVEEQLNSIGAKGERVIEVATTYEPGRVLVNGQNIPRFTLAVLVETEVPTPKTVKPA